MFTFQFGPYFSIRMWYGLLIIKKKTPGLPKGSVLCFLCKRDNLSCMPRTHCRRRNSALEVVLWPLWRNVHACTHTRARTHTHGPTHIWTQTGKHSLLIKIIINFKESHKDTHTPLKHASIQYARSDNWGSEIQQLNKIAGMPWHQAWESDHQLHHLQSLLTFEILTDFF